MKEPPADTIADALRGSGARPDSWLVGAFLVLFSVAVSAALPQITGAVRTAVADAAKNGTAERAQRPTIRLFVAGVRAVLPTLPAGHDVVPVFASLPAVPLAGERVFVRPSDLAARVQERGFRARAPPVLG